VTSLILTLSLAIGAAFALAGAAWAVRKAPSGQLLWAWVPSVILGAAVVWGGAGQVQGSTAAASPPATPPSAGPRSSSKGRILARNLGCVGCHSEDGSRRIGPTFLGIFGAARELEGGGVVEANEDYLSRSIRRPRAEIVRGFPATMPEYGERLSDAEVRALVAYLRDLRSP